MTSSGGTTDGAPAGGAPTTGPTAPDQEALRQLADRLHHMITTTFDAWGSDAGTRPPTTPPEPSAFSRPVSVPPVRMEQLSRVPEPTADLDDLVDLLVPRMLEKLVPALREALRNDDQPPTSLAEKPDGTPRRGPGPSRLRD